MTNKYPELTLPLIIATAMVFALLAAVVSTGEMQLGEQPPPSTVIAVRDISYSCPAMPEVQALEPDFVVSAEHYSHKITRHCTGKPECTIDTQQAMPLPDLYPQCAEELVLRYACVQSLTPLTMPQENLHSAYIYEGQQATIRCEP
jgi:hypothetical protein